VGITHLVRSRLTVSPTGYANSYSDTIFLVSESLPEDMDERRIEQFLRTKLRAAGRTFEEAKTAYSGAKQAALAGLPQDAEGRVKIICRRYAERRAVPLDAKARPACFDPDRVDCRGCVEDVEAGTVETW
jgi:hypothetical protein